MAIQNEPHYEITAAELAAWLERQGPNSWWSIDGDPLLMGRVSLPCAAKELAKAIRQIGEPLLVLDKNSLGDGRTITADELDRLAEVDESTNRVFALCWKRRAPRPEWLLVEDQEAALVAHIMEA